MALDPLATTAALDARGITLPDGFDADTALASASEAVREAAGCPISETTSTVKLTGSYERYLELPGGPVTNVDTVTTNDVAVTGWRLIDDKLYRSWGWQFPQPDTGFCFDTGPGQLVVTYTHGLAVVPEDIIDLVCSMVAMRAATPYDVDARVTSEAIDDFRQTFAAAGGGSAYQLPEATREWLRNRFTSQAYVSGDRGR